MRKLWVCLLVLAMLASFFAIPVSAEEYSGSCGENATWVFDPDTGTLTISGTGAMADDSVGLWYDVDYRRDITRVVVENGITSIGKCAFYCLQSVTQVQLPDTLLQIGERAFDMCTGLQSIDFPNSLQYIGKQAFRTCSGLTSLTLPDSVTECEPQAFYYCTKLTSVTLPNSLEKLPYDMFSGCDNLTSVTIPAGVKELGNGPFELCSNLSCITFLGDAPVFHKYAFGDLEALVIYPGENDTWTEDVRQDYDGTITWLPSGGASLGGTFGKTTVMTWKLENGVLTITGDGYMRGWSNGWDTPWYPYRALVKKVVLSGKLEHIYEDAFMNHTELTEIQWTNTITHVFGGVFSGCIKLKTVTMPDSITVMGDGVFSGCTSLTSVKLSANLKELRGWTFSGCTALESVTVPSKVMDLGQCVFKEGPTKVYFTGNFPHMQIPEAYGAGSFSAFTGTVYYPADNATWTAARIKEQTDFYGDTVKFVASKELNAPDGSAETAPAPDENVDTTFPTDPAPEKQEKKGKVLWIVLGAVVAGVILGEVVSRLHRKKEQKRVEK